MAERPTDGICRLARCIVELMHVVGSDKSLNSSAHISFTSLSEKQDAQCNKADALLHYIVR